MTIAPDITLHIVRDDDAAFLRGLFCACQASTHDWSFLPEDQRIILMHTQFTAQSQHYAAQFPQAARWIIHHHATPCGRLYLDRTTPVWRLLDIMILPAHQRHGIGRTVLGWMQSLADSIALHVAIHNPGAEKLYADMGFRIESQEGMHRFMVWRT